MQPFGLVNELVARDAKRVLEAVKQFANLQPQNAQVRETERARADIEAMKVQGGSWRKGGRILM